MRDMNERLLQYIWQFQYFNKTGLHTVCGEELHVIHQGTFKVHQGPDFLDARIRIGTNLWVGNVELHVHATDWQRHAHDDDPNYDNVILHVVWKISGGDKGRKGLPVLSLEHRIPMLLINQYQNWMNSRCFVPCEGQLSVAGDVVWKGWLDRLLFERLLRRSKTLVQWLGRNNFHWEETLWWLLARNFGQVVNADAFEEMARTIPYSLLLKCGSRRQVMEALLFGQCGLLEQESAEEYFQVLKREHDFLKKKHALRGIHVPVHFLRMRPACFPTVRLAQLSALVENISVLFSAVLTEDGPVPVKRLLNVGTSEFWDHHFTFDEASAYHVKKPGGAMLDSIIINSIVPLLFTYGEYRKEEKYCIKALEWMRMLRAEKNGITKRFAAQGIAVANASDTQSLLELKSEYCDRRRCLDCAVGNAILRLPLSSRSSRSIQCPD